MEIGDSERKGEENQDEKGAETERGLVKSSQKLKGNVGRMEKKGGRVVFWLDEILKRGRGGGEGEKSGQSGQSG
ncbi:hypothetical protein ACJ72_08536 [Emergomyces africanus]|uniref:Uncharacterized protein n=1 Tax=Emergomyces africanus TaxID=1955775 RepID=A0A1B7NK74_9EURO|nr:hypothetical protein ACJ72_08536 [Emergomyces africanus]